MKTIYSAYMYSYPHKTAYRELVNVNFSDYKDLLLDSCGSLYFHIPFCESKCGYCNLFSVTGQTKEYMESYISACEVQMKQYAVDLTCFSSSTVGGGDPFSLPPKLLYRMLSLTGDQTSLTIETSPNETTSEKLSILREFNAQRISIGIQSFSDSELDTLKRSHKTDSAKEALYLLKSYSFPCLNLDLIYGIPGQTFKSFEGSLNNAIAFEPDEIFIYPLYIRRGTGLSGKAINENRYEMYTLARDFLLSVGYYQVSMRQFVRKIPESSKNCGFENMLSIGCGGRSYIGNLHFCRPYAVEENQCIRIIDDFIKAENKTEISHGYILSSDEMKRRFVIKNLLYFTGVSVTEYQRIFNTAIMQDFSIISTLISDGYAVESGDYIKLTALGLSLSDYIGPMFISDEVRDKMALWNNMVIT